MVLLLGRQASHFPIIIFHLLFVIDERLQPQYLMTSEK
jgi:hypothetical protein